MRSNIVWTLCFTVLFFKSSKAVNQPLSNAPGNSTRVGKDLLREQNGNPGYSGRNLQPHNKDLHFYHDKQRETSKSQYKNLQTYSPYQINDVKQKFEATDDEIKYAENSSFKNDYWTEHCDAEPNPETSPDGVLITCKNIRQIPTASDLNHLVHSGRITSMNLQNLHLNVIRNGSFVTHPHLVFLQIKMDDGAEVESRAFVGIPALIKLILTQDHKNRPLSFTSGIFTPMEALETLDLTDSLLDFKMIFSSLFGLPNTIHTLFLNKVFINHLAVGGHTLDGEQSACLRKKGIKALHMEQNKIVKITMNFVLNLRDLEILSVRCNDMPSQPLIFLLPLTKLRYFDVGNQLYRHNCYPPNIIPPLFSPTASPQRKSSNIYIQDISALPNLRTAIMDRVINSVKTNFTELKYNMNNLTTVDISYTRKVEFYGVLCCAPKLQYLNLGYIQKFNIKPCFFKKMANLRTLIMCNSTLPNSIYNSSVRELFHMNAELEHLDLSNTGIYLDTYVFKKQSKLKYLKLCHNNLEYINPSVLKPLTSIEYLDFSHNKLSALTPYFLKLLLQIQNNRTFDNITLDVRYNMLQCDCAHLPDLSLITSIPLNIIGLHSASDPLTCMNEKGARVNMLREILHLQTICRDLAYEAVLSITLIYPIILVLIIIFSLCCRYRWKLQYYHYLAVNLLHRNQTPPQEDVIFDAFLSYHNRDEDFVDEKIVQPLMDTNDRAYQFCLHYRHFRPGYPIIDNIVDGIMKSRKTVVCISKNYIKSGWCEFETNFAHMLALSDHQKAIVPVVHPKIVKLLSINQNALPTGLSTLLMTTNYLEWPTAQEEQGLFQLRLRVALGPPMDCKHPFRLLLQD